MFTSKGCDLAIAFKNISSAEFGEGTFFFVIVPRVVTQGSGVVIDQRSSEVNTLGCGVSAVDVQR